MFQRRPAVELQLEPGDCGFVCLSAILTLLNKPVTVAQLKELIGTTSRGLSLSQMRDGLRDRGVTADIIYFDRNRRESFPSPGILLLSKGHYAIIDRRKGDRFEIFDPEFGWSLRNRRSLARNCNGLAIAVDRPPKKSAQMAPATSAPRALRDLRRVLSGKSGRFALVIFAFSQLATLALPLVSMWSVDRSTNGLSMGLFGNIFIGFFALSLTNISTTLMGELVQLKAKRVAAATLSRISFNSLASKPTTWFETSTASSIQNRVGALDTLLNFYVDLIRIAASISTTSAIGVVALIFISPILIIPSFIALALSTILDLLFDRSLKTYFASAVDTMQRRQSFVLDTLARLPLISRFGGMAAARTRYSSLVRSAAMVDARLQSLRGWRTAAGGLARSAESLFFVTLAASLMGSGNFTVGGFVALGAYKDLLAGSLASLFQLHLRNGQMEVHRLQAAELLTADEGYRPPSRTIERGAVRMAGVSFAYGSLDRPVLGGVDLVAEPGECVVIRGPSGTGKSTIAKLLVGQLAPTSGTVMLDGLAPAGALHGVGAVLQSDGLIGGSIRDNLLVYRRGFDDAELMAALEAAALDEFVRGLPMRLATQVGEGIGGLSGGQRQRLLIARALLGRPRLIIFDEATSSLEVAVEANILRRIKAGGATVILIAHRPEVWSLADRIYALDEDGMMTEIHRPAGADRGRCRRAS